ncbi:uncharacterized protein TRIVIDRAFT_65497 [Trichoderma virens Gv29-8]|uniref:Biogenesis of lysosome-related organelles complex 1 subunit 1 n=1 Tax=Hypocrea virens (strain Gv29-8 / FGSC 10586) TaxID=413071 RepID=G9N9Y7_HYPVG|nr:uncharacterized protein TRIVIDRAFT_65497 [Trichoderma virens Gv29-8]EHK16755.1 hypothetical protein TRIVIDRAFT_65497 [Trichoderma virens Gv29-8]UKZ51869.1 hypothetical protein TrVGV298_005634 [Trichoderma virens]
MSAASSSGLRRATNASNMAGPSSSPRWFSQTQSASPPSAPSVVTASAAATVSPAPAPALQPTLPSAETQRHVSEARAAVVASIGNMLDSELQSRASILHENAAALEKQERDVLRATEGLRKETQKLKTEADKAARKVKELGNVQNWAEVLERGFLVLEETVRLANGGEDTDEDGGSQCSCSCSECGRESDMNDEEDEGNDSGNGNANNGVDNGAERRMDVDGMSDASRSLMDLDSSTGTGRAKGSETASISTG